MRLTPGWNKLLLIELGEHYIPVRIGLLTRERQQKVIAEDFAKADVPVVRLSMLSPQGLIGRYGRVYDREEIAELSI